MKKVEIITLLIFGIVLIPGIIKAQNIALNKSYTLSEPPNYTDSAPPSDKTSLTDGIYTKGSFHMQPTTVGWLFKQEVTITIDLDGINPVGAIAFNTERNIDVGISFPQNIFAFISDNDKNYKYVGDVADVPENITGAMKVEKFMLKGINQNARYIKLMVVPTGPYIFCDEIEVFKGKATDKGLKNLIAKENLKNAIETIKVWDYNRKSLIQSIGNLQGTSKRNTGKPNKVLSDINAQLNNKNISNNELQILKNRIGKEHAINLKNRYNAIYFVEKNNPWDSVSEFQEPKQKSSGLNYQFLIPKDGVQYGSFVITNCNPSAQSFSFKVYSANVSVSNVRLFNIPYVPSSNLNFNRTPDPFVTVKSDITIPAGISAMFIFKISGINTGSAKSSITILSASKETKVNIDTQVQDLLIRKNADNLNAIVWAYLHSPMLKDRPKEAVRDLELHHINTIDIPPEFLPDLETADFTAFKNYLGNFRNLKNILLFMNYSSDASRNGYKNGQFMSPEWKNKFIRWYNNMTKLIHGNGFPNAHIYLFPYDEVRGKNVEDFKSFVQWAKKSVNNIKFYATLNDKAAIDVMLPLIDIAQIEYHINLLKDLPPHQSEIWTYNTVGLARSLSPYSYYRLMSWQAYANNYTGIGFWDYADEGKDKPLNLISDPLINYLRSYSVIYNGPGKEIISSRRWEAFSLGIEDYAILTLYDKKFGTSKAKNLAKQVIDNPKNESMADNARNEMIRALFGK